MHTCGSELVDRQDVPAESLTIHFFVFVVVSAKVDFLQRRIGVFKEG